MGTFSLFNASFVFNLFNASLDFKLKFLVHNMLEI